MNPSRVHITNPADGGFFYWLFKYTLFSIFGIALLAVHALIGLYIYFARSVPTVPDLATYAQRAPGITSVYAGDNTLLAELASERREVVPLDRIPQTLIDAVIATEDRRFYEHRGLDLRGLVRALRENLRHGRISQGGSTITQQVAKSFLSPERSFTRKIREAILARRLEARFSKREILALYLNHIFLGHGSFGVQAASRRYFDKNVSELGLAELALLAGLGKAPTRYSPIEHPLAAQARRDKVLRNMVEVGAISAAQAEAIYGSRIALKPRRDTSRDISPYFVDYVRRELLKQFGPQAVYEGGYRIETTVLPQLDVLAADNVDHATRQIDKRQGYRGPEARLDPDAQKLFLARASVRYAAPLQENTLYLGLVTAVRSGGATVQVGPHTLDLPILNMLWASRYTAGDPTNDRFIRSAAEALRPGDVIWVKLAHRSYIAKFSEFNYVPLTTKPLETGDALARAAGKPAETGDSSGKLTSGALAQAAPAPKPPAVAEAAKPASPPAAAASSDPSRRPAAGPRTRPGKWGSRGTTPRSVATASRGTRSGGRRTGTGSATAPAGTGAHDGSPAQVAQRDSGPPTGMRFVPGTGVQVIIDGAGVRLAAQPPAPGKRIEVGEAVWIPEQVRKPTPQAQKEAVLEQAPRPQGAIYSFDLHTGYILSMAGGSDYDRSEFNRAVQACRQPGSAYKPVYYSLALDRGYSYDTIWNDRVRTEVDPVTGEEWIPQNIDGTYGQTVNLERALVWSKNPPALEIFKTLGKKDVAAWARRLGFTTPIHADDALALGASCVRIDEISRAFALFATGGRPVESVGIKRVFDRSGRVLYDASAWDDPLLDGPSRLDRMVATAGRARRPVIAPRTAYLMDTLLRRVVSQGHSKPIRDAKLIAAGKTGTSSRTSDVWFVGHTSRWMTTAWLGDDTYERQLGYTDASFTISVPMWTRYMYAANHEAPLAELPVDKPATVKPNDRGGPLLPGFPLPPLAAMGSEARMRELPEHLRHLRVVPAAGDTTGPTLGQAASGASALKGGSSEPLRAAAVAKPGTAAQGGSAVRGQTGPVTATSPGPRPPISTPHPAGPRPVPGKGPRPVRPGARKPGPPAPPPPVVF